MEKWNLRNKIITGGASVESDSGVRILNIILMSLSLSYQIRYQMMLTEDVSVGRMMLKNAQVINGMEDFQMLIECCRFRKLGRCFGTICHHLSTSFTPKLPRLQLIAC